MPYAALYKISILLLTIRYKHYLNIVLEIYVKSGKLQRQFFGRYSYLCHFVDILLSLEHLNMASTS